MAFIILLQILFVEIMILYFLIRRLEGETFYKKLLNFLNTKTWLGICVFFLLVGIYSKNPFTIVINLFNGLTCFLRRRNISKEKQ